MYITVKVTERVSFELRSQQFKISVFSVDDATKKPKTGCNAEQQPAAVLSAL